MHPDTLFIRWHLWVEDQEGPDWSHLVVVLEVSPVNFPRFKLRTFLKLLVDTSLEEHGWETER